MMYELTFVSAKPVVEEIKRRFLRYLVQSLKEVKGQCIIRRQKVHVHQMQLLHRVGHAERRQVVPVGRDDPRQAPQLEMRRHRRDRLERVLRQVQRVVPEHGENVQEQHVPTPPVRVPYQRIANLIGRGRRALQQAVLVARRHKPAQPAAVVQPLRLITLRAITERPGPDHHSGNCDDGDRCEEEQPWGTAACCRPTCRPAYVHRCSIGTCWSAG